MELDENVNLNLEIKHFAEQNTKVIEPKQIKFLTQGVKTLEMEKTQTLKAFSDSSLRQQVLTPES